MDTPELKPYDVLGLDPDCTDDQIRSAYRLLAKQYHPDVNRGSAEAVRQTQRLNAAYEVLGDPARRQAYDRARAAAAPPPVTRSRSRLDRDIAQEMQLGPMDFLRGTTLEVRVMDPGNPQGPETYSLVVPAGTAPGTRLRVTRTGPFAGGIVAVKLKARGDARFQVRGSDLRCDLRIPTQRAAQGGVELVRGADGNSHRVTIPRGAARGEILRVPGQGLPNARGGRGDLLVKLVYTPEVRITRARSA